MSKDEVQFLMVVLIIFGVTMLIIVGMMMHAAFKDQDQYRVKGPRGLPAWERPKDMRDY